MMFQSNETTRKRRLNFQMAKVEDMVLQLEKYISRWTVALIILSAAVFTFLSINHAFVSMWIEGFFEYARLIAVFVGKDTPTSLDCLLPVGNTWLMLGLNEYTGATPMYVDVPAAWLWYNSWTNDPFIFRYTGIFVFLSCGWLLYLVTRKLYSPSIAFYSASLFLVIPNIFLTTLTERWWFLNMTIVHLILAWFFIRYLQGGSDFFLIASGFWLGMTITTRVEAFIWLIFPVTLFLIIAKPVIIFERWAMTRHKWAIVPATLVGFALGISSFIAYNLTCPRMNLLGYLQRQIIPNAQSNTTGSLIDKIPVRLEQFWSFSLLNQFKFFQLWTPNYLFAILWGIATVILVVKSIREQKPNLLLMMLATSAPLTLIVTNRPRDEHLIILQPVFILVITTGLAQLDKFKPCGKKLRHLILGLSLVSGLLTSAMDWQYWQSIPPTTQTMLNQSDPVLLTETLLRDYPQDHILFTNIGLGQYVRYTSNNRLNGKEILEWFSIERFANNIKLSLLNKNKRRVFVAVSLERDGTAGTLPRTRLLYGLLKQYNIPYTVTHLANSRNANLYDLIVVDPGVTLNNSLDFSSGILVSSVGMNPPMGNKIEGTIYGIGFKPGDIAIVNDSLATPTVFGGSTWVTFGIQLDQLENQSSFELKIIRLTTMEQSPPILVTLP